MVLVESWPREELAWDLEGGSEAVSVTWQRSPRLESRGASGVQLVRTLLPSVYSSSILSVDPVDQG